MSKKYEKVLSRRTLLRGAGAVAIGLPFLDAMRTESVYAAGPEPPPRAFNLFFGLGFPTPIQDEGFSGPMAPLAPLADKLLVLRGVDQVRCDEGGINAHFDGAAGAFTAMPPDGESRAGGISIDQMIRRELYPEGQPAGVIPTLLMGTYFRRSRPARYIHSWNQDGTPADLPRESPAALFNRVFGEDPSMMTPDDPTGRDRYRRSVLDSVVEQYRHYQSDASNLGTASRARIADHFDRVREHERRAFGENGGESCMRPAEPTGSTVPHGDGADPDGEGIDVTLSDIRTEWRLMSDLYALAIQCDLVRFGGATFQAAGERIRLTGRYEYDGSLVYVFDDRAERGVDGAQGCSHEWWHAFRPGNDNPQLRAHLHLMMEEMAYLLGQLDDPEHADENGQSILENALITISTESGDGRHSDVTRELSGVFHAISGANERFATGQILDVGAEAIDVYNTMLDACGVTGRLGPDGRGFEPVTPILR